MSLPVTEEQRRRSTPNRRQLGDELLDLVDRLPTNCLQKTDLLLLGKKVLAADEFIQLTGIKS